VSGCSEAQVTAPPTATASPFALFSLPPIGYNHRFGNNPVTAADAFALERALFAKKEYWEVALSAQPYAVGYVDALNPQADAAARPAFTSLTMVIASESLPTLRQMVANGDAGQKAYCIQFLDQLRSEGYTGLTDVTLTVYFGESDRHATLTWTRKAGYSYTIYDNNLNGLLTRPLPSATPFATPPQR